MGFLKATKDVNLNKVQVAALLLLSIAAFTIPVSTAMTNFFAVLAACLVVFGVNKTGIKQTLKSNIGTFSLLLFFLLGISTIWSVAPTPEILETLSKYRKLILIFLFGYLLCKYPLNFLDPLKFCCVAVFVVNTLSLLLWLERDLVDWIPKYIHNIQIGNQENPTVFKSHITQGALSAYAVFLSLFFASNTNSKFRARLWLAGGLLSAGVTLFLLQGRTGPFLILSGMLFLLGSLYLKNEKKFSVLISGTLVTIMVLIGFSNQELLARFTRIQEEVVRSSTEDVKTSSGDRLLFLTTALKIAQNSPILGAGVGSYNKSFQEAAPEVKRYLGAHTQPHSEIANIIVQAGGLGLLIFLLINFYAIKVSLDSENQSNTQISSHFLGATAFTALSASMINSVLHDSTDGHFLMIFWATLMAKELIRFTKASAVVP